MFRNKKNTPKLFNNKIKKIVNKPLTYINNDTGKTRHFTPAAQEWFNSIYAYDHNYIKSLPVADKHLMNLLKSYFNMQIKDEKIKNKRNIIKNRRVSTKRVFIGRGELKHSNNKVIITFYVYNTEAMFLWGNVKKAWEILYRPKKDLEISINEDTKDKEVESQYKSFNLITWLKRLKNKYVLRTLINKKTKKEKNMILFSKPIPNSKNSVLDLKEIWNILNRLGYSNSFPELKLRINEIDNTVAQKNIAVNTKNSCLLLKKYQDILINKYIINNKKINKNIEKKFEIISFNRPLSLKHGQILPINEDINNKRMIKLNRPLSLNEFLFQFDFDTHIHNMQKNILLNKMNKYYSSLINLFETKVLTNKEISWIFSDKVKYISTLFEEKKIWKQKIWYEKTLGRSVKQLYTFVNFIKRVVKNGYRDTHLLLPLYLFRFNQTKFGMYFMEKLTHLVKNLYNKEVVFNIVNLKNMHLSSDIYTQAVVLKLKNRDNKLYRVLKSSLRKIKIPNFSKINEKNNKPNKKEFIDNKIRNSLINSMFTAEQEDVKDPLNNLLLNFFPSAENLQTSVVKKGSVKNCSISLKDYVLMYLKHIKVRGIRVEAKGRLTRRFTASRSVFKMKWKGGLKNVDSSFKGLSTIMLRGYVKSNAQYSFINSKNRNGAFGVKGWVSNK
jgi:hypothetical protein